jgi:hypothetical protein
MYRFSVGALSYVKFVLNMLILPGHYGLVLSDFIIFILHELSTCSDLLIRQLSIIDLAAALGRTTPIVLLHGTLFARAFHVNIEIFSAAIVCVMLFLLDINS